MNPWQELGLDEGVLDKKQIKRAYAKRLKITKPDEKPESFQRLHEAYKLALSLSDQQQKNTQQSSEDAYSDPALLSQEGSIQPDELHHNDAHMFDETASLSSVNNDAKSQSAEEICHQKITTLKQRVIDTLHWPATVNDTASWFFLHEDEAIFDHGIIDPMKIFMFEQISSYNVREFEKDKADEAHLVPETIVFLDGLFGWSHEREAFESSYSKEACQAVFNLIDYHQAQKSRQATTGGEVINSDVLSSESIQKIAMAFLSITAVMIALILFVYFSS